MRVLLIISALCLLAGGGLIWRASRISVYTDADAPSRLSIELEKLPREQRFHEWHTQLPKYETAHKKIYDYGEGVAALGAGGLLVAAFLAARKKFSFARGKLPLTVTWLLAWAMQLPCVMWYYFVRQQRFDFPTWGDSVAIPIFRQTFFIAAGASVTTLLLLALTMSRADTGHFSFRKPADGRGWAVLATLSLWMVLLALMVTVSVPFGNITYIIPCAPGMAVLFVAAFGMEKNTAPRNPLTVSGGDFAHWFKFTLIHPALSLLLYFLGTGLPQGGTMGGVAFGATMLMMLINMPGLTIIQLLMTLAYAVNNDLVKNFVSNISSEKIFMLPAVFITWALIVAVAWWIYRRR